MPVHPTQLYEGVGLAVLGWLLIRWRRNGVPDGIVLARYLVCAGALRFAVEWLRVDQRVAYGMSVAHLASLAVIAVGLIALALQRSPRRTS